MAFRVRLIYSDGDSDIDDDVYETEEEAEEAGSYLCSCFHQGRDVLELAGEDYVEGSVDYEVFEE